MSRILTATPVRPLAYSLGAVATALSYQAFAAYIIFFYVDVVHLSAGLAAWGMLIWGVFNAINDPVLGFISDRTQTRWGRRIPYILFCAVPFGLIYFLVWSPPFNVTQELWLFLYFLIFICLFDLCYTMTILNWASLFPEMFKSLEERARVNSFRQAFGMLGLMIGIALPPFIFSTIGWRAMGAIFGAIITLVFLISVWGSKEKEKSPGPQPGFIPAMKFTFINRSFIPFVASNLLIQYAFTMILAMMPFYAKYVLRINEASTGFLMLAAFASAFLMMFLWRRIAVSLGAKRSYLLAISLMGAALIPFLFVGSYIYAVLTAVLVGAGFAGIILVSDVLISDIIDEDGINSGARREGMYFGVNAFICRFAIALEALSIGVVFTRAYYNPYVISQTREFLSGLRMLLAGLPILALLVAFIIMKYYPLEGERLKWIKEKLSS